jgi:hypothetical protein
MNIYLLLANVVLVVHFAYVLTVVFGLVAIVVGLLLRKAWARNFWLRMGHLAMIGIVVLQSWMGTLCPLTVLENMLRRRANQPGYPRDFIGYWLHHVMFFSFPPWVFAIVYTAFGALVVATFIFGPPRWPARGAGS